MTNMTVAEAQSRKGDLQVNILQLLNRFEEETGLRVKAVHTTCAYEVGGKARTYDLDIEVDFT